MLVKRLLLVAAWRFICVPDLEAISLVGATLEEDVHKEIAALRAQLETVKEALREALKGTFRGSFRGSKRL